MNRALPILLASLLALAACGEEPNDVVENADEADSLEEALDQSEIEEEAGEAVTSVEDAAEEAGQRIRNATEEMTEGVLEAGDAAREAVQELGEAVAPTLERAEEAGEELARDAQEGMNDVTRSAACQTARAADDAEGIAANCEE